MTESDWIATVERKLADRRRQRDSLVSAKQAHETDLAANTSLLASLHEVDAQVKALALSCQNNCRSSIELLVTRCLEAVFPENRYRFNLIFEEKRNQTEARIALTDKEGNEYDPLLNNGGGVADVIAFALRLATLMLKVPQPAKVLVLDEPFRCVSADHRGRLADLLESLANELGFQIIMVTHMKELAKGNVIELYWLSSKTTYQKQNALYRLRRRKHCWSLVIWVLSKYPTINQRPIQFRVLGIGWRSIDQEPLAENRFLTLTTVTIWRDLA